MSILAIEWEFGVVTRATNSPSLVWPGGVRCQLCGKNMKVDDGFMAGVINGIGTVSFHRRCIVPLINEHFPESMFSEIRDRIIEANGDPFGLEVCNA